MQSYHRGRYVAAALTLLVVCGGGCDASKPDGQAAVDISGPPPSTGGHDHGQGHAGHGHAGHGHPSEGPHHGALIELGNEEYHAEMLHDDATAKITVYILDSTAKQEVAVPEDGVTLNVMIDGTPTQFELAAANAKDGLASQFEVVSEKLLEEIETADELKGRLNVTIDGKPFVGDIEHATHDDHDHGHEH